MNKPESLDQIGKRRIPSAEELGFDPQEMRSKYDFERDRRLRADGEEQYEETDGDLYHYNDDPQTDEWFVRDLVQKEIEIAILGGGFGGLLMAARLQEAGITNFRLVERGGDFGGTWYWNRYPGARCDTSSLEYSYSFSPQLEQEWEWSERYPGQAEILSYLNHVADRFDLRPNIRFNTRLNQAEFQDSKNQWQLGLDNNHQLSCRFLLMATGCLFLIL